MALTATTYGPYRVLRPLGQGGGGTVHLAAHQDSGEAVALKLITLNAGRDRRRLDPPRARFLLEADAMRRLVHPNIAAVIAAGESGGMGWIALELLPGSSLLRYTQASRLLPEPLVCRVGAAVAQALAYAHGLGVIHRDVKPSNVMVDWPSDSVKLTDFGVAHVADGVVTRTGVVLGSPAFLAPEQLAGGLPDARSDLYALGVTLFQLVAGRLPFDAPTMGELLHQVATAQAPDLRELTPSTSPALAALVAKLLCKTASQRPAEAAAVASALAVCVSK